MSEQVAVKVAITVSGRLYVWCLTKDEAEAQSGANLIALVQRHDLMHHWSMDRPDDGPVYYRAVAREDQAKNVSAMLLLEQRRPAIALHFVLPGGLVLRRDLTLEDIRSTDGQRIESMLRDGPPEWLSDTNREWPDPQGPIEFYGHVKPGHEDDAREALGL